MPPPTERISPFHPFCSDRCQRIDLGQWLNESYHVPVETERVLREAIEDLPDELAE